MSTLAEYVTQLGGADEAERIYAAEDIGALNHPDGVPPLLARLAHEPSLAVREAIFRALGQMDGDAVIEGAIALLEHDDPQLRNQAVALLRQKDARSIDFLRTAMRTGDRDVRKLVLDVLSGMWSADAGAIYSAALSDTDPNVVITAVENLGRTRATRFRSAIEALLRADAHPMLLGACLEALTGVGDRSSVASIRRCFPDAAALPDFLLVPWLKAMAALGSNEEFALVSNLLATRAPHLRSAILGALIALHANCDAPDPEQGTLSLLRAMIEEGADPPLTRYQAARLLGVWADRDDVCAWLVACLDSPERLVRLGAVESLRATARADLAQVLAARALEESDEDVKQALR